jgi:NAD(P)-dependent dehydrogenase (short-subunit alcohol dehydrogenase family)
MSGRLDGGRVLVVGAGTRPAPPDAPAGNGRAIAVLCGREGADVVCADVDTGAAEATADLVRAEGATADVVTGDVGTEDGCAAVAEAAGEVTGLVLNVGIGLGRDLANTSVHDWDTAFAVNLRSHFLLCKLLLPTMPEGGSIVFISSAAGIRSGTRIPSYDASKAGIFGLSRSVALEGARRGVRANVVAPGLIDTPLGRVASEGRPSRTKTPVPMGRQGTAWEVAAATVFLLSSDASSTTGAILTVDGGLCMH